VSTVVAPASGQGRAWVLAARPATLPAAAVPVLVGGSAAVSEGAQFQLLVFAVTLAAALLIQIGTNFANDYSDFKRGADREGRVGPVRVTQTGLLTPEAVRRGIAVAFGLAVLLGCYLTWIGGWPIAMIGIVSLVCALAYTGGPWPFGYHGLGDVFVFLFFGIVAVTGTAYLQTGEWSSFALASSVPIGLLVTSILVVNNLRDLPTDSAAGKNTLAVRLGDRGTRTEYMLLIAVAYATAAALAFSSPTREWLLLPWATAPLAIALIASVFSGVGGSELNRVLKRTGLLLLFFGVLFSLGLLHSTSSWQAT
jgi:1,4-dihydroxy-2-naphthoate octaprenyltransferase